MKRVLLESAYVLHRRLYRENSFLVELFTKDHGRLTVVAKGMRKARSSQAGLLQPFFPLLVSFAGRNELMALTHVEAAGEFKLLKGDCLFSGFYLNELLVNLLEKWDPHPGLFLIYEKTLEALQKNILDERNLRIFEKRFLEELGYGVLSQADALQNKFLPDKYYYFVYDQGFVQNNLENNDESKPMVFSGKNLSAIAQEALDTEEILQDAKRLTRLIMAPLLGKRPIHSRRLFMQPGEKTNAK